MAGGRFCKNAIAGSPSRFWNGNNIQDTVIGGAISTAPANIGASGGNQNLPGDRTILGPSDALALSNNSIGNLYTGTYRYVAFRNNSTANPARGRAVFWDPTATGTGNNISSTAADATYQVTADGNGANYTNSLFAGVAINNMTMANGTPAYWWIQESGKATVKFIAAITGTPAIASPVFLPLTAPANNNATDNGAFDVLAGANSAAIFAANSTTAYTTVGGMVQNYIGVAETLPSNNNLSIIDIPFSKGGFRW